MVQQLNLFGEVVKLKTKVGEERKCGLCGTPLIMGDAVGGYCQKCYPRIKAEGELEREVEEAEFSMWEEVNKVACPHCGEAEAILVEPDGDDVYYYCGECEQQIDESWLMSQLPQEVKERVNRAKESWENYWREKGDR